jgi:DNA-binding NtrC family response regulator
MMNELHNLKGLAVLVIDDEIAALDSMEQALQGVGAQVSRAESIKDALGITQNNALDIIIAALDLVNEQCIEMVKDYKLRYPSCLFYVLTDQEYESVETSQESVKYIVDDYIRKPLDIERFVVMVETSMGRTISSSTSLTVVDPLVAKVKPYFLFRSPVMRRALTHLPQISASEQTVLITGETGSGKEIVARGIHVLSPRSSGPFVPINCGAVPESLIEGELFGHEKGAFTGAIKSRRGKFETADRGTLFLDEISEMPLNLQVRLLRVLEDGVIYSVGGEEPITVNVRVIAASNVDLQKAVRDGLFREDLYYRINVLRINLPPLRERVEDIPLLAVHFLERAFVEMGWQPPFPSLSAETIYVLEQYRWRGNVRELRNIMTRIATLLPQNTRRIFPHHILPHIEESGVFKTAETHETTPEGVFIPLGTPMKKVEDIMIKESLKYTNGNKTKAANLLGISLRNLRRKINK